MPRKFWIFSILCLGALFSACQPPAVTAPTPGPSAPVTRTTATADATPTAAATRIGPRTATPTPTEPPRVCDRAGFVADRTIPDGSDIGGGAPFRKTWVLRNDGTCTWTPDYLLVFYGGARMGGPNTQPLATWAVAPGGTVQITVALRAPASIGAYTGYWVLRNPAGEVFGIGPKGSAFFVQIVVSSDATATPTPTLTPTETPNARIFSIKRGVG